MRTMAFLTQKGGSGKTTLAVHLAVAAQADDNFVVLVDTDPQKSAMAWREERVKKTPLVVSTPAREIGQAIDLARGDKADVFIVDTAPHAGPEATRIARAVDFVAIPCRPSAFDIAAIKNAVNIVRAAGTKAAFVLSACPFRMPEIVEARDTLLQYGLPVAPVQITDRRAFSRAVSSGRAVTEFEENGKAAEEINALWAWTKEFMQWD